MNTEETRMGKNGGMKTFSTFAFVCLLASGCTTKPVAPATLANNGRAQEALRDGSRFYELGRLDEAEHKLQEVLAIDTNNAVARYYLALVQREQIDHRRPAIFTYHKTVVTNHQTIPPQQRTLESFGSFDSSTTVEDVINRVGRPDTGQNISGFHTWYYFFGPRGTNCLVISSSGESFIYRVAHGKHVLYERAQADW